MKNIIIQILGPTGVGKSEISIYLSKIFKGEVISADSIQVYKGFDIGSSKIKSDQKSGIPHHMIDILEPVEQFNVNKFLEFSCKIVNEIQARDRLPIVCGGTALYLRGMIRGIFDESSDRRISRETLNEIEIKYGTAYLWRRLKRIDGKYADKIGGNDKKRIIRGLEIYYNNRVIPSNISTITFSPFNSYRFIRIGLKLPREVMYEKINSRVDRMVAEGLFSEVMELRRKYSDECSPMNAIGYKEINQVINKSIDMKVAVDLIKQHSRNFAKRQMTWFNSENDIDWFDPDDKRGMSEFILRQLNE